MAAIWLLLILVASTQSGQIRGQAARDDTLYKKKRDTFVAGIQDGVDTFREEFMSTLGTLQEVVVGKQTLMK